MVESSNDRLPIVVALTGASGTIYGLRLIDRLLTLGCSVDVCISAAAVTVWRRELAPGCASSGDARQFLHSMRESLSEIADACPDVPAGEQGDAGRLRLYRIDQLTAPIASGSFRTTGMVICPCSTGTLAAVANGLSQNLIHRAAEVHLKERRRLIVVPRETPLSRITLENMRRLTDAGAVVLPAAPGFYHRPRTVIELVDFIVARICDHLGLEHDIGSRWAG